LADSSQDAGVIFALVDRFNKQRLPRALELKERVDKGERLSEQDIAFLDQVFKDANHIKPLVEKHPEWQDLAARAMGLYKEITEKALENEKES